MMFRCHANGMILPIAALMLAVILLLGAPTAVSACPMCKDGLIMAGTKEAAMARLEARRRAQVQAQQQRAKGYNKSVLLLLAVPLFGVSAAAIIAVRFWGRDEDWAVSPQHPHMARMNLEIRINS